MTVYNINEPASNVMNYPSSLKNQDVMIFNHTAIGRAGYMFEWIVPRTAIYEIEAFGAQGGTGVSNVAAKFIGGKGARMKGQFSLKSGEKVNIVVGQMGSNGGSSESAGGGGGSFVYTGLVGGDGLLIVAGGGGGGGEESTAIGRDGQAGTLGLNGQNQLVGPEGHGATGTAYCTGGAGWLSDGVKSGGTGNPGTRFVGGLKPSTNVGDGGYGGGASGEHSDGGGGAGGYTGGPPSKSSTRTTWGGGGAGSYNVGIEQSNSSGVRSGHGLVTITAIGEPPLILLKDNGEIKTHKEGLWQTIEGADYMTYPTVEQFKEYGMSDLSDLTEEAIDQLGENFKIFALSVDASVDFLEVETTALPKRQLVIQEEEMHLPAPIKSFTLTASVSGSSVLRIIASIDNGITWSAYDGVEWKSVNVADLDEVAASGMTVEAFNEITEEVWRPYLTDLKLRLAYYLDLDQVEDALVLDKLSYETVPVVNKTPKLNSIKITYDDLTIEGRLKDLERINAINMAKLNFKSNALLLSEKYEMHDMVIDTCDTDEVTVISSSGAGEKIKANQAFSEPQALGAGKISEISLSQFTKMKKVEVR